MQPEEKQPTKLENTNCPDFAGGLSEWNRAHVFFPKMPRTDDMQLRTGDECGGRSCGSKRSDSVGSGW